MNILYVDDEYCAHTIFASSIQEFLPESNVSYHFDYDSAVAYAKTHHLDCAFLDVALAQKDGISLAKELRIIQPHLEFAFITGFDQFAREAYQVEGRAYLTKPYAIADLGRVLHLFQRLTQPPLHPVSVPSSSLYAKTFGNFDLLRDGIPVHFKNAKSKELLAYLIHQMGGTANNDQVFFALWERQDYCNTTSTYVRRTIRALQDDLAQVGLGHLIMAHRNCVSVDMRTIFCDAQALLQGDIQMAIQFNGAYMLPYPWGKSTLPLLEKAASRLLEQTKSI